MTNKEKFIEEIEILLETKDSLNALAKFKSLEQPLLLLGKNLVAWKELEKVLSELEVKDSLKAVPDSSLAQ